MEPFVIVSDLHFHNWSAFAGVNEEGINTRLFTLMQEVAKAAEVLQAAGGKRMYVAGDVFHVRGRVAPSVFNPVQVLFETLVESGIEVIILAGNHDIEGKESNDLGSAVTALRSVGCTTVSSQGGIHTGVVLVPWSEDRAYVLSELKRMDNSDLYAIIHAPVNEVIKGLPPNGLDPDELNALKYKAIFAGHYHNHKQVREKVWSIGAIAHHTWSDVDSKAGYILVDRSGVHYRASHAPRFIEIVPGMSEMDMQLEADGNYIKARLETSSLIEIADCRQMLLDAGALGVSIIAEPAKMTVARTTAGITKGETLEASIEKFVDASSFAEAANLKAYCYDVLTKIRSAA